MMRQPPITAEQLSAASPGEQRATAAADVSQTTDPILCQHCGRSASNGISCQGICVADSGY